MPKKTTAGKGKLLNSKPAKKQLAGKPLIVTSGLPYANGPIHLGHLVEYIQTDIIVRALKLAGKEVIYCCADDTHGTPIEVNALKLGIKPEELIAKCYKEHQQDLADYHIKFDSFYSTNSAENKKLADFIFEALKEAGLIYTKEIELTYCPNCKRFLPDRFVKGKCPKCEAEEQYGDSCEACGASYSTTELVNPHCVICKTTPVKKKSLHYFFKLSEFNEKLGDWLTTNKNLPSETKNQMLRWVEDGLKDWDISRDGPYFGFKIPGEENKYYYVWLDAPIGYISSLAHYFKGDTTKAVEHWNKSDILHVIGKDIAYFHFLFWPATLMGAKLNLPNTILVHGFLTVNGEKMSKSRGTFITANEFLKLTNPEYLRFYYASRLDRTPTDIDLNLNDFKEKINSELVSNIANFCYRTLSFANTQLDSKLGKISKQDAKLAKQLEAKFSKVVESYQNYEIKDAVKQILEISSEGNAYFQSNAPWKIIKEGSEGKARAKEVVTLAANIVKNLSILLKPIVPDFAEKIEQQLKLNNLTFADLGFNLEEHEINRAEIVFKNIEQLEIKTEEPFAKLNLKVGKILEAKQHPDADKLIVIQVDLGNHGKRQVVAGMTQFYRPEELVGKKIVLVTNMKPAKLRGVESNGMMLAAELAGKVKVLEAPKSQPGEQIFIAGVKPGEKQITIEEFAEIKLTTKDKKAYCGNKQLKTKAEDISVDIADGAAIK
jgi:methionyl-tRNA synthetase